MNIYAPQMWGASLSPSFCLRLVDEGMRHGRSHCSSIVFLPGSVWRRCCWGVRGDLFLHGGGVRTSVGHSIPAAARWKMWLLGNQRASSNAALENADSWLITRHSAVGDGCQSCSTDHQRKREMCPLGGHHRKRKRSLQVICERERTKRNCSIYSQAWVAAYQPGPLLLGV